jgi:hypothetical protein
VVELTVFGGDLQATVENFTRLEAGEREAAAALATAREAVKDAEARDVATAAAARVAGEDEPESVAVPEARRVFELAQREAKVAAVAVNAAELAIVDAIRRDRAVYDGRVDKSIEASTKTAKNALRRLEEALAERQHAQALKRWLDAPVTGNGRLHDPAPMPARVYTKYFTTANGEPVSAHDLCAAVAEAIGG